MPPSDLLAALAAELPPSALVDDPDVLEAYRRDQTPLIDAGMPAAACFPTTADEVSRILRAASARRVPVVPRGAGSGLAGGANALDGCLVLCTSRMNQIVCVNADDQLAVVQPGVLNGELKAAAQAVGLDYPPDPASYEFSTLGGNIATNAGGLCCVKYGVTRDYVLALEVALADGTIVRTGRTTAKGVAGYDLTALFVGSEGTLGVVTEATLRLRPARPSPATVVAFFADLADAGRAVIDIGRGGVVPSMLELMDGATLAAVEAWQRMDLDTGAAALLLAQSDAAGEAGQAAEVRAIAAACQAAGATYVADTADPEEGRMLLAARRFAYPALERLGGTLLDDVAVPRSRIPELLAGTQRIAAEHRATVGTFGHAGDGNFHPTVVYDRADPDSRAAALETFDAIVRLALSLGGTVTGEHGVGTLKRGHLAAELSPAALALHRSVKDALDPLGILNPGKVLSVRG